MRDFLMGACKNENAPAVTSTVEGVVAGSGFAMVKIQQNQHFAS
jgi:hypothetical protein